jgi:hypothetical protein
MNMKRITVFITAYILSMGLAVAADIFNLTDTWNAGGTTFDAIKMVVTDTASASDSRLINVTASTGGTFQVNKDGSLTMTGTQFIAEQADAGVDVAGYGQIWVNTAVPNELWFTDDAGTDFQLGVPATPHTPEGTAILSTGEVGGVKFLREDGDNTSSWQALPASIANVVEDTTPVLGGELSNGGFDYVMTEVADHSSTPAAGFGYLWTKNTAPATLIFTDDAGTDFDLTAGGGGWSVEDDTNFNYGHGLNALDSLSTGVRNIGIGNQAGTSLSSGNDNIIIGDLAGDALTVSSDRNVVIGSNAGSALASSDDDNVFIGHGAGKVNTNSDNVMIGSGAGDDSVNQFKNTFVGGIAGSQGNYNTAIGWGSLRVNSASGTNNTALGNDAGISVTDGDFNVLLGSDAGTGLSTGNYNTIVGAEAGSGLDYTTGDESIIIGYYATPLSATADLQLTIGSQGTSASVVAVSAITGYMGATTDFDNSGNDLTITGPSALIAAVTNLDGGDLNINGGAAATTGIGIGGNVNINGGLKGSTGTQGFSLVNDTVYGIMSTQGGVTSQDDIGTTPEILVAWNTDGISNGTTVSSANDYITADVAGVYEVVGSLSFSGTANSTVTMEIYIYDDSGTSWSASGFALERKLGSGGDVGRASVSGLVTLDTSDRVAIYVATDGATDDVTTTESVLHIKRISN